MGASAIGYEVLKNIAQTDMSRAGFYAASTDIIPYMSSGRYDERKGVFPVPPAIEISTDLVRGLATADSDVLAYTLPRLLPAGVALSRALGVLPEVPGLGFVGQRTYADWKSPTQDGSIPLFKGDGSLLGYEQPSTLILRGIGADLGKFQEQSQIDNWLTRNSEEMQGYRQQYVSQLLAGDMRGAEGTKGTYARRFKMPLVVSKSQIQSAIEQRNVPRTERILNRMPANLRAGYGVAASQGREGAFNVPAQSLQTGATLKERQAQRQTAYTVSPEIRAQIEKTLAESLPGGNQTFAPFSGYSP